MGCTCEYRLRQGQLTLGVPQKKPWGLPAYLEEDVLCFTRSTLEYSAAIWGPHLIKHKDFLERPQRRAARWIKRDYHTRASATAMLRELRLDLLENRRKASSLTMTFKVLNGHVGIPPEDLGFLPADSHTRANHRWKQQHIQSKTTELQHSFSVRTIPFWNGLPACVAEAASVDSFKRQLAAVAV